MKKRITITLQQRLDGTFHIERMTNAATFPTGGGLGQEPRKWHVLGEVIPLVRAEYVCQDRGYEVTVNAVKE